LPNRPTQMNPEKAVQVRGRPSSLRYDAAIASTRQGVRPNLISVFHGAQLRAPRPVEIMPRAKAPIVSPYFTGRGHATRPPSSALCDFSATSLIPAVALLWRGTGATSCPCGIPKCGLSAEIFHAQAAAFDDAFQCADGNGFAAVHATSPAAIFMTPFDGCRLRHQSKPCLRRTLRFLACANWKSPAHARRVP